MPTGKKYEQEWFVWMHMASEMLHTEAVGKYLKYPNQTQAIQNAYSTAYKQIKMIGAGTDAPQPWACQPPFCDSGVGKCVPCGLDEAKDASKGKAAGRIDAPPRAGRGKRARTGDNGSRRPKGRTQPRA